MTNTTSQRHRHVCTDPLHVVEGPKGSVLFFFPDGQSVALTVEAAAQSTLLLAQTVRNASAKARIKRGRASPAGEPLGGTVIPVNFNA
ncbi:MAG: hypothetical protein V4579_05725 [Pseudomonadota bacterium]